MSIELITMILFGSLGLALAVGVPVAFALGGIGVLFTLFLWGPEALFLIPLKTIGTTRTIILIAIPLFIFMANILEQSDVADDLYTMMHHWLGWLPGGLAIGTVLICTIFAAMSGISGPAMMTMGIIALPAMLKRQYSKELAVGCIAAGGALGILIPPSVTMIVYALFTGESVGRLFLGGVLPGLVLSALFCLYIAIRCGFRPQLAPRVPIQERATYREKFISLKAVILPSLLVIGVLGAIFTGSATPTEAAAVGAAGSILCAIINHSFNWQKFQAAISRTYSITVMMMWLLIGASCFVSVYTGIGAPQLIQNIMATLPVGPWAILIGIQLIYFILGMFLDPMGIIMITIPVFIPVIRSLGFDPVWFGVLFIMNMEMAYLTPPFGLNLFYLSALIPKDITMVDVYRSIVPFVGLQAIGLAVVMIFPQLVLWLPHLVFG